METTSYAANSATSTTTTSVSTGPGVGFDRSYLTSIMGIVNIVIVASAFCLAISASVPPTYWNGTSVASFSSFVGWEIFVFNLVIYLFYMMRIVPKLPGPMGLVFLVYILVDILFLFISIILCAINIETFQGPAGAATAFGIICFASHVFLGYLFFQKWRSLGHHFHKGECGHKYAVATTTTTTASTESAEPGRY